MSDATQPEVQRRLQALGLQSARLWHLAVAGVVICAGALFIPLPDLRVAVLAAGGGLLALSGLLAVWDVRRKARATVSARSVSGFVEHDQAPCFTTDADGMIVYQNAAATAEFGGCAGHSLAGLLSGQFASPAAILNRLRARAMVEGAAREDVALRRGHLRLSVHRLDRHGYLWRLEDLAEGRAAWGGDGISLPMLTVSRAGRVLYMNEALRRIVGTPHKTLDRIIVDLPLRSGDVHRVSTPEGSRGVTVVELPSVAGRRELYFLPLVVALKDVEWDFADAIPVPLVKLDGDGTVIMANRMARALLHVRGEETIAFGGLVEGLGRPLQDWIAEAAGGRGTGRPEFLKVTRAPQDTYAQITLSPYEEEGKASVLAVLNDATELKTLEAQFVQSQKMQAIGQLAGGVAHDFNNLLTAIAGHCDLLLLRRDPGDPDYADLDQIHQNANRAAALVSQLLAFSRKQNLRPELLDLVETMADLGHLLNRLVGETVTLNLTHDPEIRPIRADRRQFEQVIVNLVVNARDAMHEGGTIDLTIEPRLLTEELSRDRAVVPPGDYIEIRVTDHGTGIDPDNLPKVFEPFFTTKRAGEGTGLGLSTVYGIVKQTGGFIFVDSERGSGTSFTLYFPAQDPAAMPREAAPEPARPRPTEGKGVVLLVEDEAPVRAFASRALRLRGYTVLEAACAEEALDRLKDASLAVDIFVTDVIMPGMDGPTWVTRALEDRPGTRVVFVSGYAEESIAEDHARIPDSVFLPKPFSLHQLTETVQSQLH